MKTIIYEYLITLLALSNADSERVEISAKCVDKIMDNIIAADRCMDEQIGTPVDIFNRLKWLVFSYNHSDEGFVNLVEFADHNCAYIPQTLQCLQLKYSYTAECPVYIQQLDDVHQMVYSGIERLANYVCADNFNVIRKLIANDGLRFLLVNDDLDKCFENVADRQIDHAEQICSLIDVAAPCVLQLVADHRNEYVPRVAYDIIEGFRTVAHC